MNEIEVLEYKSKLNFPIPKGFQIQKDNNPITVLVATKGAFVEQILYKGKLKGKQTLNTFLKIINKENIEYMNKNRMDSPNKNYFFYKEVTDIKYPQQIYVENMIRNNTIVRMMISYFVEPKTKEVFQINICCGPLDEQNTSVKLYEVDLGNDNITKTLYALLDTIINNIKEI